jgi:hypothetical protein
MRSKYDLNNMEINLTDVGKIIILLFIRQVVKHRCWADTNFKHSLGSVKIIIIKKQKMFEYFFALDKFKTKYVQN